MKDLTVLVRTYKENLQMLERCLTSLSNQKNIDKSKIIIYNDGCDIDVLNCINNHIKQYPTLNISVFYKNHNLGAGNALKELYKLATTEYIIFCDGDDEYIINDGLEFAITNLKEKNWEFINCDNGPYKLHPMTIFRKNIISEKLFINFYTREDEYMSYVYNFRNGGFLIYPFYKWNYKHSPNQVHCRKMNNDEKMLWDIYSNLLNKRITIDEAKYQLNEIKNTQCLDIYSSLVDLFN